MMLPDTIIAMALTASAPSQSTTTTRFVWSMFESETISSVKLEASALEDRALSESARDVRAELFELTRLPDGWSSYGTRPNEVAFDVASAVAAPLEQAGHLPYLVTPVADGGMALRYSSDEREVRIEASNDGEIVLVTQTSPESALEYEDIATPTDAVDRLLEFLGE